jgi:hypothetical protein
MNTLIDISYFTRELVIPNLKSLSGVGWTSSEIASSNDELLTGFIEKYEWAYLKELLGVELRDAFVQGLEIEPVPEKWLRLKEQIVDERRKESPIAAYVYYFFRRNDATDYTGIGEAATTGDNSKRADPTEKMMKAWFQMMIRSREIRAWLHSKPEYGYRDTRSDIFRMILPC